MMTEQIDPDIADLRIRQARINGLLEEAKGQLVRVKKLNARLTESIASWRARAASSGAGRA